MSEVEVDILLQSVLVVDSYGIPTILYLFQNLLYLILHLCIQLDLLVGHCTEATDYTAWGYTMDARYYIMVQCYMSWYLVKMW
jgi:hypothetical protein